ncbi:unnamed protein product [Arabidopsis halleri]
MSVLREELIKGNLIEENGSTNTHNLFHPLSTEARHRLVHQVFHLPILGKAQHF